MIASDEDSRIVAPFIASLSNISLTVVAIQLYNEFGIKALQAAISEMESRNGPKLRSRVCLNSRRRLKDILNSIPTVLRRRLLVEVKKADKEISYWIWLHNFINRLDPTKCTLFWRSDGTINTIKTAQGIARNQHVDIRARFEISCIYCLDNEVQTLWVEIEENRKGKNYERDLNVKPLLGFWVRWVREGTKTSWIQAALEYLSHGETTNLELYPIFRELMPAERHNYFSLLKFCTPYDFRYCLYTLTKEEQERVMRDHGVKVLEIYMAFPFLRDFLDTAEKAFAFLDGSQFCKVLKLLLQRKDNRNFDFGNLAEEFWNRSPCHLKEFAKEIIFASSGYSSFLFRKFIEEQTVKRKVDYDNQASLKRFRKK